MLTDAAGFTTPNVLEAETDQALISSAVSDHGLPDDARTILAEHIDQIVLAPVRSRAPARSSEL